MEEAPKVCLFILSDYYSTLTFKKQLKLKKMLKHQRMPAPKQSQESADDGSAPGSPSSGDSGTSSDESSSDELAGVSEPKLRCMFKDEVSIFYLARR